MGFYHELKKDLRNIFAERKEYERYRNPLKMEFEEVQMLDGQNEYETIGNVEKEIIRYMNEKKYGDEYYRDSLKMSSFKEMLDSIFEFRTNIGDVVYDTKIDGIKLYSSKGDFAIRENSNNNMQSLTLGKIKGMAARRFDNSASEWIVIGVSIQFRTKYMAETIMAEYNMD